MPERDFNLVFECAVCVCLPMHPGILEQISLKYQDALDRTDIELNPSLVTTAELCQRWARPDLNWSYLHPKQEGYQATPRARV